MNSDELKIQEQPSVILEAINNKNSLFVKTSDCPPVISMPKERESVKILLECIDLQIKKSNDYQNPNSRIRQADYYPRGIASLLDTVNAKCLRMFSVMEAMENDPNYKPNFESLEDSAKDIINYASFIAAWLRNGIDGQSPDRDFLNRKINAKN